MEYLYIRGVTSLRES